MRVAIGVRLHDARRRRRISMDRAATETRIRREYIVAMEKGDFSFQAPAYVKGFLGNYARFLRLDPVPLVREFDQAVGVGPSEARVLADQNALWNGTVLMPSAFRPLVVTTAALMILTVAALWTKAGREIAVPRSGPETSAPVTKEADDAAKRGEGARQVAAPTAPKSRVLSVTIAATRARSWLEIVADGRLVFTGMLERGRSETVRAKGSVRLVLGYPSGVELTVDGRRLGSPGGDDVIELALPDDLPKLT